MGEIILEKDTRSSADQEREGSISLQQGDSGHTDHSPLEPVQSTNTDHRDKLCLEQGAADNSVSEQTAPVEPLIPGDNSYPDRSSDTLPPPVVSPVGVEQRPRASTTSQLLNGAGVGKCSLP